MDDKAGIATGVWVEYAVTSVVTGNGTYSFKISPTSSDGTDFNSREARTNKPQLVLNVKSNDVTPPETSIASGPTGAVNSASATFGFSSDEPSTFECSLDLVPFGPCTSPSTYTALSEGTHTFRVRAKDTAGNVDATPATRTWTDRLRAET